jgi:hypothetical protein
MVINTARVPSATSHMRSAGIPLAGETLIPINARLSTVLYQFQLLTIFGGQWSTQASGDKQTPHRIDPAD